MFERNKMSAFAKLVPSTKQEWKIKKKKRRCATFIQTYIGSLNKILEKRSADLKSDWLHSEIEDANERYFMTKVFDLIEKYGLRIKTLHRIVHTLKWTQQKKYLISNIWDRPYDFINHEYQLISFDKVETINKHERLGANLKERTRTWIFHIFLKGGRLYEKDGKILKGRDVQPEFFLPYKVVQDQWWYFLHYSMCPLLKKDNVFIKKERDRILHTFLIRKNGKYSTNEFVKWEKTLGETLLDLYYDTDGNDIPTKDILDFIKEYEQEENITLTNNQKTAICNGIQKKFSIITGYPGSGKSTIVKAILQFKKTDTFCLTAPTGLAVKNLIEKCGGVKLIGTNHKLHYVTLPKIRESGTMWVNHIIIDETSMIDFFMFKKLISWCEYFNCQLTLVGDQYQLPPIGYGNPFSQIIASDIFADVTTELLVIKRNSGVLSKNIIKLNKGQLKISDFDNETMIFIHDKYVKNIHQHLQDIKDKYGEIQIIASQKKSSGVYDLNIIGQEIYNADGEILTSGMEKYKIGDKVIRTENDYSNPDKMRVNGDMATIVGNDGHEKVVIQYTDDNEKQIMTWADFWDNFMHFYASTVHKVQGSQYPTIVVVIPTAHQWMWRQDGARALLYTALSRAQDRCIVIGSREIFERAQKKLIKSPESIFMKEFHEYEF